MSEGQGLLTLVCRRSVGNTADALATAMTARGIAVYGRIDMAARAAGAGTSLRPMELILFGDPAVVLPLIGENPMAAMDLPMRALVWEDENGDVWITYPDAAFLVERYALDQKVAGDIAAIRRDLAAVVSAAAGV